MNRSLKNSNKNFLKFLGVVCAVAAVNSCDKDNTNSNDKGNHQPDKTKTTTTNEDKFESIKKEKDLKVLKKILLDKDVINNKEAQIEINKIIKDCIYDIRLLRDFLNVKINSNDDLKELLEVASILKKNYNYTNLKFYLCDGFNFNFFLDNTKKYNIGEYKDLLSFNGFGDWHIEGKGNDFSIYLGGRGDSIAIDLGNIENFIEFLKGIYSIEEGNRFPKLNVVEKDGGFFVITSYSSFSEYHNHIFEFKFLDKNNISKGLDYLDTLKNCNLIEKFLEKIQLDYRSQFTKDYACEICRPSAVSEKKEILGVALDSVLNMKDKVLFERFLKTVFGDRCTDIDKDNFKFSYKPLKNDQFIKDVEWL